MTPKNYCSQLLVFSSLFTLAEAVQALDPAWWSSVAQLSLHHSPLMEYKVRRPDCWKLPGLSPGQTRICEVFPTHMQFVGLGARKAIEECQFQFRQRRWNCSTYGNSIFGPVHDQGTREAAYTYAIVSAGVTHTVSRGCKLSQLDTCGCDESRRPNNLKKDWIWGGCGDNIQYGYEFSQNFIDVRERELKHQKDTDLYGQNMMNRWNNQIGRKLIKRKARTKCKCHGVSGSCNLKTCWYQLATIREIGMALLKKYESAVRVTINHRGNLQMLKSEKRKRRKSKKRGRVRRMDLVFLDDSPDYCKIDPKNGVTGTAGRQCTTEGNGPESCNVLCCGRGYDTLDKTTFEECDCKFEWCCKVVCKRCERRRIIHVCKDGPTLEA